MSGNLSSTTVWCRSARLLGQPTQDTCIRKLLTSFRTVQDLQVPTQSARAHNLKQISRQLKILSGGELPLGTMRFQLQSDKRLNWTSSNHNWKRGFKRMFNWTSCSPDCLIGQCFNPLVANHSTCAIELCRSTILLVHLLQTTALVWPNRFLIQDQLLHYASDTKIKNKIGNLRESLVAYHSTCVVLLVESLVAYHSTCVVLSVESLVANHSTCVIVLLVESLVANHSTRVIFLLVEPLVAHHSTCVIFIYLI